MRTIIKIEKISVYNIYNIQHLFTMQSTTKFTSNMASMFPDLCTFKAYVSAWKSYVTNSTSVVTIDDKQVMMFRHFPLGTAPDIRRDVRYHEHLSSDEFIDLVPHSAPYWNNTPRTELNQTLINRITDGDKFPTITGPGILSPTTVGAHYTEVYDTVVIVWTGTTFKVLAGSRKRFEEICDTRARYCLVGGGIKEGVESNLAGALRELVEEGFAGSADFIADLAKRNVYIGQFAQTGDSRATKNLCAIDHLRYIFVDASKESELYDTIESKLLVGDVEELEKPGFVEVDQFFDAARASNVVFGHEAIVMECFDHLWRNNKITTSQYVNVYQSYYN
jgi:hypothetical protein